MSVVKDEGGFRAGERKSGISQPEPLHQAMGWPVRVATESQE